ncbi:MAG: cation:proton antiporter, partial [Phycisphaerales bacterium]|nr:cation:proton antiporter [Phycisphaerales bacterium]
AAGSVFVCCGVSMLLHVTYLLAAMVMGMVVVNLARHHRRPFHAIEGIERPAMVLFFVLAGASLQFAALARIGWIGAAYVVFRIVGRLVGGYAGARLSGAPPALQRWMGLALMPQAGVALGMALVASERFPDLRPTILPVTIAATVLFELSGPLLTRLALVHAGEVATERRR